jgi:cyanophycin synthetase
MALGLPPTSVWRRPPRYPSLMGTNQGVRLTELRVLDGPNLYFTRPAIKMSLAVPGWLELDPTRAASLAAGIGLPGTDPESSAAARVRPGPPRSQQRLRFIARLAAHVTRSLASTAGTALAVRSRAGPGPDTVVVAFPWRRRTSAEALAKEVADLLGTILHTRKSFDRLLTETIRRLDGVEPGPPPPVPDPDIPVIAVTGTNGKTTTVRALAHVIRSGGFDVAYSSTDGVYFNGRLVEEGDYSGFGGAALALSQPGVDVAVLETARGGILLRGIGTMHNTVGVVTNVSADHLGLHGIVSLDQLAEVKSTITRITRSDGWDVLNADDPRVLAMRRGIRGRPWLFSLDPDHPAIRAVVSEGGRATTVTDGQLTYFTGGMRSHPLLPLEDVPLTLAGISTHNTHNAMAVASAALGIGLSDDAVVKGLRTFVHDPETNPGRTNLFELDGRIVVADYAHNEAGMTGLIETCRGLRQPGGEIWLAYACAGDRTNEILHGMGYIAARGADHVAIAELLHYLRGRERNDLVERLRAGAIDGGATDVPVFEDEMRALQWMLESSHPGDLLAVTALVQRPELFALMNERGGVQIGPDRVRELVRRARAGR